MKEVQLLKEGQEGFGLLVETDAGIISNNLTTNNKRIFEDLNSRVRKSDFDGHFYIDCKLQEADVLNRNGRVYPRAILEKQINEYQKLINDNAALNEADHPENITISLQNISHRITKTWWSGNAVYGTLDIIVSDSFLRDGIGWTIGDKIALYLQRNLKLGISSRGLGSVKKVGGKNIVQDDFEIICFDLVATPSTPNAYLFLETKNEPLQESVEIQNNNVKKYDDSIRKIIGG
jgi:hypothetical protein